MVGAALCPRCTLPHATVTCSVISRPRATRYPRCHPCPIRHRSALISAIWLLAATIPAAARGHYRCRASRRSGRGRFICVDKMKDGPLKQQLSQCTGPFRKTDFLHRPPRRRAGIPRAHTESYVAAARMGAGVIECDVTFTKDRQLVCRAFAVRPAHHDQHFDGAGAGREMLASLQPRPIPPPAEGVGQVLHLRHHARRIQAADREDGRLQSGGKDAGGVPRTARRAGALIFMPIPAR